MISRSASGLNKSGIVMVLLPIGLPVRFPANAQATWRGRNRRFVGPASRPKLDRTAVLHGVGGSAAQKLWIGHGHYTPARSDHADGGTYRIDVSKLTPPCYAGSRPWRSAFPAAWRPNTATVAAADAVVPQYLGQAVDQAQGLLAGGQRPHRPGRRRGGAWTTAGCCWWRSAVAWRRWLKTISARRSAI